MLQPSVPASLGDSGLEIARCGYNTAKAILDCQDVKAVNKLK